MAASTALRLLLGASLGFGTLDVAWIDLALAPRATETGARAASPSAGALRATRDAPGPPGAVTVTPVEPAPPPVEPPPTPAVVDERVYFATRSAALDAAARMHVERVARQASAGAVFVLQGHADYRGGEALNRTLSRDRARAVAGYLARLGVPRARIRVGWVGKAGAAASDELWRDRRVDLHVGVER